MDLASPTGTLLDFEDARQRMVDSQVRPNKVTDPRVLAAMRRTAREKFLPPHLLPLAYADEDVPLGKGRALMEPMVIARLLQLLAPMPGERMLVIAAGVGYGAALLAEIGAVVTALEDDPDLLAIARAALAEIAPSVSIVTGPLTEGWAEGAPYDAILIEGAVHDIPEAIGKQLRPGAGRLATVRVGAGLTGKAVIAEMTPVGLHAQPAFDCAVPLLPAFAPKPGFVF